MYNRLVRKKRSERSRYTLNIENLTPHGCPEVPMKIRAAATIVMEK
jgi:hypothetical protein